MSNSDNINSNLPEYYNFENESMSFKAWYSIHKSSVYSDKPYYHHFIYDIYDNVLHDLCPAIHKLLLKHYPVLKTEKRQAVLKHFDEIADFVADWILWRAYGIINDGNNGVNFREKYPKFDHWKDFYCKPRQTKTLSEKGRRWHPDYTDAEWEAYKEKENKALLEFHLWTENRVAEFMEIVRQSLFKYFPEITDLSSDGWVLYAVNVRDAYSNFQSLGEEMEIFIDYGFPEEFINLPGDDFYKKIRETPAEIQKHSQELRNRRIAGEQI